MSDDERAMHYVCTHDEAKKLIDKHDRFWVSNCGCREGRGFCARSRFDLCLMFYGDIDPSGSGMKEISADQVREILNEAEEKQLVSRPFRNGDDGERTDGICFCCDDCCGYFINKAERCDKGSQIEITNFADCTHCGICAEVCYFEARRMHKHELTVDRDKCYGCGLCVNICPEDCIEMIRR
jgi:ferredoxin